MQGVGFRVLGLRIFPPRMNDRIGRIVCSRFAVLHGMFVGTVDPIKYGFASCSVRQERIRAS